MNPSPLIDHAPLRVTIWNEFVHEKQNPEVQKLYPRGIHGALAERLAGPGLALRTATLEEPEHGLSAEVLRQTDVLLWWGHAAHEQVSDEVVRRVQERVWEGMGLLALHSAHRSKIFRALSGTSGKLHWREAAERERLWTIDPAHPIARGLPETFVLPVEEMYGEPFMIAGDAHVVFLSWFEGGEVFRSGFTFQRGHGRVFYFRPGHEAYPTYENPHVLQVLRNAIHWAAPILSAPYPKTHRPESLEPIEEKAGTYGKAGIVTP
ncbi:MAG: ThuA domain-containing protein [Spirochaetes bacterium]|nr:ThuA domain-containing protein [Spirochaetota bacterium]